MRRVLALSPLFVALAAGAQVYRWVGPDGTVHFGDQPGPGATEVQVAPVTTVPAAPVQRGRPPGVGPSLGAIAYQQFAVVSPADNGAVRANDGNVAVILALDPPLQPGHRVLVRLDGQPVGEPGTSLTVDLTNLDRGTHRIEAVVLGAGGTELITAGPTSFHVLRASAAPRVVPR